MENDYNIKLSFKRNYRCTGEDNGCKTYKSLTTGHAKINYDIGDSKNLIMSDILLKAYEIMKGYEEKARIEKEGV